MAPKRRSTSFRRVFCFTGPTPFRRLATGAAGPTYPLSMNSRLSPELASRTGLGAAATPESDEKLLYYINLKLRELGCPTFALKVDSEFADLMSGLLALNHEKDRLLSNHLCPADQRIQNFLYDYLEDTTVAPRLPGQTFVLDRYGLARLLSIPPDRNEFVSDIITSYRVKQGVLHNPKSDRRTTEGIFHIAEGGLPVPDDKKSVPKAVFSRLLQHAFNPPSELLRLPFTATQPQQAECFVSLHLRPVVCPHVPGYTPQKAMETRFFVPGSLVSNLDFVESIFGNAGDPRLPENDAALDPEHWTGHTGCVILAPHLTKLTKKDLGLPHWDYATERQRRDRMCWRDSAELYNDGVAFKITARDTSGVIVTIISDNYFGYCKKEVKTQLSYSANLYGLCEEEHAGGALIFPSYDLAGDFSAERSAHMFPNMPTLAEAMALLGDAVTAHPDGYYIDREQPKVLYVPVQAYFDLLKQQVSWTHEGRAISLKLRADHTYMLPNGYKIRLQKPRGKLGWRLTGTSGESTLCHKPCTVSGGGKSEISKSISDAILGGPVFVADIKADFDAVEALLARDYSQRFREPEKRGSDTRPILSARRSLGSVIKLLSPSPDFTDEYNTWLAAIPPHIKELVFVLKRLYKAEWGNEWRKHFQVDVIDGSPANELRLKTRKLEAHFLRVGFSPNGSWRTFSLRKDFNPAQKIQMEDDITASVVVPRERLTGLAASTHQPSLKIVQNCEYRLFQRPDDAIHRGYDHQTESDFARDGSFFSNYSPLTPPQAREMVEEAVSFDEFTAPMQGVIRDAAKLPDNAFFVCSAYPRLVDGKPSKNPRYLQVRSDLLQPMECFLAERGLHLARRVPIGQPVPTPVDAVLAGRRNNPADLPAGIRSLAIYSPLHYMELPELFMEFICSMTGKSPSTTGAGSEGALTKGPFNALPPIYDLNATFVSFVVTGYAGFISSAGCVGPKTRVDHDISLLVPEVWSRLSVEERDPAAMIKEGFLERCADFEYKGRNVLASRLGYRITKQFVTHFCGRIFNQPHAVFTDDMLRPELQDLAAFVDGMDNVIATQRRVSQHYFNDGSIEQACPPLRALLHIMRDDQYEGRGLDHPEIRALFTREHLLASDWYKARLAAKQTIDIAAWRQHVNYLTKFVAKSNYAGESARLGIAARLEHARATHAHVQSPGYLTELVGTLGAEPALVQK